MKTDTDLQNLLAEHADAAAEMTAELERYGYVQIPEARGYLRRGARVRHVGAQYSEAFDNGTGVVAAVLQRHPGDIEVVVVSWMLSAKRPQVGQWADYHCDSVLTLSTYLSEA